MISFGETDKERDVWAEVWYDNVRRSTGFGAPPGPVPARDRGRFSRGSFSTVGFNVRCGGNASRSFLSQTIDSKNRCRAVRDVCCSAITSALFRCKSDSTREHSLHAADVLLVTKQSLPL